MRKTIARKHAIGGGAFSPRNLNRPWLDCRRLHFGGLAPTCAPPNAPTGAAPRAAVAASPSLSGLDARNALCGLPSRAPCGCCSAPHSLPSVGRLGAVETAPAAHDPPLCVGSLREARRRARCAPPPCHVSASSLPAFRYAPFRSVRRSVVSLSSLRSASHPLGSHRSHIPPFLPSVGRSGCVWVRLAPLASLGPRLRLKAKPARRGVVRLFEASTAGATPPAHGRALGRPKTDDGGGRFAPCALPSVGHRLSVFPWRLPPSLGVPSGAPHEAAARRSLRSLCLAPPSTWLSLPAVARPCRGGSLRASLRSAAIRPRSLRPRAAIPLSRQAQPAPLMQVQNKAW